MELHINAEAVLLTEVCDIEVISIFKSKRREDIKSVRDKDEYEVCTPYEVNEGDVIDMISIEDSSGPWTSRQRKEVVEVLTGGVPDSQIIKLKKL